MSDIEKRIRMLEDIEAIKILKARYCEHCDNDYAPDAIAAQFTEDGCWDGGGFGVHRGRTAIRDFFAQVSSVAVFAAHHVTNPQIVVSGDQARGKWLLWQAVVMQPGDQAFWLSATYEDQYVRSDKGWLFKHVKLDTRLFTPYEIGFGKQRIAAFELSAG